MIAEKLHDNIILGPVDKAPEGLILSSEGFAFIPAQTCNPIFIAPRLQQAWINSRTHGDMFGRDVGEPSKPGYGPLSLVKRLVRTRMPGVVGLEKKTPGCAVM